MSRKVSQEVSSACSAASCCFSSIKKVCIFELVCVQVWDLMTVTNGKPFRADSVSLHSRRGNVCLCVFMCVYTCVRLAIKFPSLSTIPLLLLPEFPQSSSFYPSLCLHHSSIPSTWMSVCRNSLKGLRSLFTNVCWLSLLALFIYPFTLSAIYQILLVTLLKNPLLCRHFPLFLPLLPFSLFLSMNRFAWYFKPSRLPLWQILILLIKC